MEKTIVLAGGCFWGLQKFFDQFPGIQTEVGYANGNPKWDHPTYQQVCQGSGHAEAVEIRYDASIALPQILAVYFAVIDPVSINRQGNDVGINYRTGIYVNNLADLKTANLMIEDLQKKLRRPIAVEVLPLENFYSAEEYHQKYLQKNPAGYCHLPRHLLSGHVLPTLAMVEKQYPGIASIYKKDKTGF